MRDEHDKNIWTDNDVESHWFRRTFSGKKSRNDKNPKGFGGCGCGLFVLLVVAFALAKACG